MKKRVKVKKKKQVPIITNDALYLFFKETADMVDAQQAKLVELENTIIGLKTELEFFKGVSKVRSAAPVRTQDMLYGEDTSPWSLDISHSEILRRALDVTDQETVVDEGSEQINRSLLSTFSGILNQDFSDIERRALLGGNPVVGYGDYSVGYEEDEEDEG